MSHFGKSSEFVDIIHKKTKVSHDDIYDILWVLPEVFAEYFMKMQPKENELVHMGVLNAHWQTPKPKSPLIVFSCTDRFKKQLAQEKFMRKNELAQLFFDMLKPDVKDKMGRKRAKKLS